VRRLSDLARFWPRVTGGRVAAHAAAADPLLAEQWAVAPGAVLNLPGAWELSEGAGVTVAVVDSGTRIDHPDLAPNVWTNFREIPGNGVDDDGNGFVDDVHGVDLTTTAAQQDLTDANGHGTHVAGIIAAAANDKGVVGVAPRAKIMTVKVLDAEGRGTTGGVEAAIRYAVANGARIVNLSLVAEQPDSRLDAAIALAASANVLVVAAAGNAGRDIDVQPAYPAAIPAPNLVSVAATTPAEGRDIASFSNYGQLTVQLAAPGDAILSTSNNGDYVEESGTSMAAPMVAGVAALMAGANPRLAVADLRALLLQNAVRSRIPVAAGYLDARHSVLAAATAVGADAAQPPQLRVLRATTKGRRTDVQVAARGSTLAIARYSVSLDGRRVAQMAARASPFTVTVRRRARRVRVVALSSAGRVLARAQAPVRAVRSGKRGTAGGKRVGT
jgi:subtilisin family serine protease